VSVSSGMLALFCRHFESHNRAHRTSDLWEACVRGVDVRIWQDSDWDIIGVGDASLEGVEKDAFFGFLCYRV
jgi:hypothetical protein